MFKRVKIWQQLRLALHITTMPNHCNKQVTRKEIKFFDTQAL